MLMSAQTRTEIDRHVLEVELEVDGGIDSATIGTAARAGATVFCAGSALFNGPGTMADRVAALREAAAAADEVDRLAIATTGAAVRGSS